MSPRVRRSSGKKMRFAAAALGVLALVCGVGMALYGLIGMGAGYMLFGVFFLLIFGVLVVRRRQARMNAGGPRRGMALPVALLAVALAGAFLAAAAVLTRMTRADAVRRSTRARLRASLFEAAGTALRGGSETGAGLQGQAESPDGVRVAWSVERQVDGPAGTRRLFALRAAAEAGGMRRECWAMAQVEPGGSGRVLMWVER